MKSDVLIMGGGAAGLLCAIAVKMNNPERQVLVLEKNDRVGKKLLATGNGRCNLGNDQALPQNYHSVAGDGAAFAAAALRKYPPADNKRFFEQLGLLVRSDEMGRQYPYTNQAGSVLDILRLRLAALAVEVRTDSEVVQIRREQGGGFILETVSGERHSAAKLVIAAGGLTSPQISNAQGMADILRRLGHESSRSFPALTQVKTEGKLPKALKGIRIPCAVTLYTAGAAAQREEGELLFADYGISGIPAFQLSRRVSENFACPNPQEQWVEIDTLPQLAAADIIDILKERSCTFDTALEDFLVGMVNKKLGQQVLKMAGLAPLSRSCGSLTADEIGRTAQILKHLRLNVSGTTGWRNAQVTAGGLLTEQFSAETLESKPVPGLFAIGEALDIDGDCGGYNLTWAWSSARLAAESLAAD